MFDTKPLTNFIGEDEEDNSLLKGMAEEAKDWLLNQEFCRSIEEIRFGEGVGGIVASFLANYTDDSNHNENHIWVIVGDIPFCHFNINRDKVENGEDAIFHYCSMMGDWVDAIFEGKSIDTLVKVNVPPTIEWAKKLSKRINMIAKIFMGENI